MRKINADHYLENLPENTATAAIPEWPVFTDRRYQLMDYLYMAELRQIIYSQTGIHSGRQDKRIN